MKNLILIILCSLTVCSCGNGNASRSEDVFPHERVQSAEKNAILKTLNKETRDAFQRDFDAWSSNWIHDSTISKTYINFSDSTFSESIGWKNISGYVKEFMVKHPEPEPVPELLHNINVRLFGKGAWVTYEQMDSIRGKKRETRLMEKVNGQWKIAGMQTTIYGFHQ